MSTLSPTRLGWLAALFATSMALPAVADTVAYWKMDETDWEAVRRDAVGDYDLFGRGGWSTADAATATIGNADPLVGGANPAASYRYRGHVTEYAPELDMRDQAWTFEGFFDFREDLFDWTATTSYVIAGTRYNGSLPVPRGWSFYMYQGRLYLYTTDESGNNVSVRTPAVIGGSGPNFATGGTHHFAVQWDPGTDFTAGSGDGTMRILVDGQVWAEGDGQGDLGAPDPTLGNPAGGGPFQQTPQYRWFAVGHYNTPFGINNTPTQGTANSPFEGYLDELRFSTGILSAPEMLNFPLCGDVAIANATTVKPPNYDTISIGAGDWDVGIYASDPNNPEWVGSHPNEFASFGWDRIENTGTTVVTTDVLVDAPSGDASPDDFLGQVFVPSRSGTPNGDGRFYGYAEQVTGEILEPGKQYDVEALMGVAATANADGIAALEIWAGGNLLAKWEQDQSLIAAGYLLPVGGSFITDASTPGLGQPITIRLSILGDANNGSNIDTLNFESVVMDWCLIPEPGTGLTVLLLAGLAGLRRR